MLALLDLNHMEAGFSDDDILRVGLSLANGEAVRMNVTRIMERFHSPFTVPVFCGGAIAR
jgi:hypothetical protein